MCIGNTTSPAANNTTNVRYGWGRPDEWETPQVFTPPGGPEVSDQAGATKKRSSLKAKPKSQSSRTSGGTY